MIEKHISAALNALEAKDWPSAAGHLQKILLKYKNHTPADVFVLLSMAYRFQGIFSKSNNIIQHATTIYPLNLNIYKEYSEIPRFQNDYVEFNKRLQIIKKACPNSLKVIEMNNGSINTIDILAICNSDHANRAFNSVYSLNSVGVKTLGLKCCPHPFKYPNQLPIANIHDILEIIKKSRIVWFTHGCISLLEKVKFFLKDKIVFVSYSGTDYRQNFDIHNRMFNPIVKKSIIIGHDFMNLGAKNPEYNNCRAVDTKKLKFSYTNNRIPVIAHYPSRPRNKGTAEIVQVLDDLKNDGYNFEYDISTERLSWIDNIKRISKCDIYIDQLQREQNGKLLGEFGNASLEAASLGKVVITNCLNMTYYCENHGKPELQIVNTQEDMRNRLAQIIRLPKSELCEMQNKTRLWIENTHSYEAMGVSLLKHFKEYL